MLQKIEHYVGEVSKKIELTDEAKKAMLYGCAVVGAYKVMQTGKDVFYGMWKHMVRPRKNLMARYARDGKQPWAVITGGAGGIGLAYAKELAVEGFALCIIDKDQQALGYLRSQLNIAPNKLVTIEYDFVECGSESGLAKLETQLQERLAGKDVAILINNVAEFQHQLLVNAPWNYILRASHVNAHSYAAMARHFLPSLLSRSSDRVKSAIINVGTCAAEPQNPRYQFSIYGASKAYGHIMSSSLREMHGDKLDVMTVIPRQTETAMNPAGYMFTVKTGTHAKAVFDQLGYETETYGPLTHDLEYALRFKYTVFGAFDSYVQWCNQTGNEKVIAEYNKR